MNRFIIITNKEKDEDFRLTNIIVTYLKNSGKQVEVSQVSSGEEFRHKLNSMEIECVIVLGGDGTIIQTANDIMRYDIPILGVNLGTLGFLAEIDESNVLESLERLFVDDFQVEKRLMLQGDISFSHKEEKDITSYALNDVVIARKGFSRIISLGIYVNDELVEHFRGDGVIISTPTGSTAYNLSAGGPLVISRANVMVITPICPHSLSPRSIVVSADDTVKVVVGKSKKSQEAEAIVTYDGSKVIDLGTDDIVLIKKAQHETKLIKLNRTGIFDILQSKLGNNGD